MNDVKDKRHQPVHAIESRRINNEASLAARSEQSGGTEFLEVKRKGCRKNLQRFANIAGLPMLRLHDRPLSGWGLVLKSAEDRVLAMLLLLQVNLQT